MGIGRQWLSGRCTGWAVGVLLGMGVCFTGPMEAEAQGADGPFTAQMQPVLLHSDRLDGVSGGVRFQAQYDRRWYSDPRTNAFRTGGYVRAETQGALALKARYNPEHVAARVDGGLSINMSRHTPTPFQPDDTTATLAPRSRYYGRLSLGAEARTETNQSLDEVNISGGVRVAYTYIRNEGWQGLIPSVVAEAEWVTPVASDVRDVMELALDAFPRLHLAASWNVPVGAYLGGKPLRPLGLHIDTRYYKSWRLDPALVDIDVDEAAYVAASVSYGLVGRVPFVNEVFVRFSDGRLPPAFREDTFFFVGVVLGRHR